MDSKRINIVRVAGRAVKAIMPNGEVIYRPDNDVIFVPAWGRKVKAAEYDNHFCYYWENAPEHSNLLMCTCGAFAGAVGYQAYKQDASPSSGGLVPGEMLVCHVHANTGKHADGSK